MTDFRRHNEEVRRVWDAYRNGIPVRVPVGNFTIGPRIWLLNPALNTAGITMERFSTDPEVMFQVLLEYKHYLHHHVPHDIEMGVPADGWEVFVEFNNVHEAAWLGCDIRYAEGQVPATLPRYTGDRKHEIFERGIPDPFSGVYGRVKECYEYFLERARSCEFHGKPVRVALPGSGLSTDGPLTVALDLCGDAILGDMLVEPEYYHRLMDLIVEATLRKARAWRAYLGIEARPQTGWFSDDAVQLISTDTYRECVLPYHRRLLDGLYAGGPYGMHLCGNVQRHLPTIARELNINHFDTGFPIDFAALRDELGDDVHVNGGVRVDILLSGSPATIREEVRRILSSGIMRGGKFVMKEANNMPPCTPEENVRAMYEATREFGVYPARPVRVCGRG